MVSARPPPNPSKGRVAYPSASTYTPGDDNKSPTYIGDSAPIHRLTSRDSDRERAQGLKTWWKSFREHTEPKQSSERHVFGVPLSESIDYASVQISTAGDGGALYVWGAVPIVVAKCGLYLKENATEVEGTFRISGSAKRMRELQAVFDTDPKFGKDVDWKTLPFTTHDVATIFRRFLTQMPESIIPFDFYDDFRNVLDQSVEVNELIGRYQALVRAIPPVNQYLLLYVLDLLHVFAKNSHKNLMTAPNLALIFQPGVLSHPVHAMRPMDHVLSQRVLEFLIEHQDHFLVGMQLSTKKKKRKSVHSPSRVKSPSPDSEATPAMVKAEEGFMLPSDSDDETPEGGYYVVEGSLRKPLSSPGRGLDSTGLTSTSQPSNRSSEPRDAPRASRSATIATETEAMEPSDSDEEVPVGGYEVRTSDPARARVVILSRNRNRMNSNAQQSDSAPGNKGGLTRRRTVPARLAGRSRGFALPRGLLREAP